MVKNIFITGRPGCGKTSLIKELIRELNLDAAGFYTQEIREGNVRKGFKIITLNGKEGILAHVNIKSSYRVSKYKVNLKDLERIGVKSILDALKENKIVIIDEIGKQEMCSTKFRETTISALNSKNKILGTIKLTYDPFTDKIKKRSDTAIFKLTEENKAEIKEKIKELILRPLL